MKFTLAHSAAGNLLALRGGYDRGQGLANSCSLRPPLERMLDIVLYLVHHCAIDVVVREKKINARFYHSATGASPVLEWIRSLPLEDRHAIGQDLARVEFGWRLGCLCAAH